MPEKILIVDDEPDMLKLLSMILREKKHLMKLQLQTILLKQLS